MNVAVMSPKVSLITTVYNREKYLSQAIDSVLAQSYQNFELLIWDDGSCDTSLQIAKHYASIDSRVKVFSTNHQGRAVALRAAHDLASGEYIGWLDSDDYLADTALEETVALLEADQSIGWVYSDYQLIDAYSQNRGCGKRCQIPFSMNRLLVDFMTFHFRLIRRSIFDLAGGINTDFPCAVDYDLSLRLSEVANVYHLKRPLYFYRVHSDCISQQSRHSQIYYSRKAISDALVRRRLAETWMIDVEVPSTFEGDQQACFRLKPIPKADKARISSFHPWVRSISHALLGVQVALGFATNPVWAKPISVTKDGTNTKITRNGKTYIIQGGALSKNGKNLFHGFQDFNLDSGQVADFISTADIKNILARINGGRPSVINGTIKVSGGNSNLFLMNPSGILFGKNATLNLPAAFSATTANC